MTSRTVCTMIFTAGTALLAMTPAFADARGRQFRVMNRSNAARHDVYEAIDIVRNRG